MGGYVRHAGKWKGTWVGSHVKLYLWKLPRSQGISNETTHTEEKNTIHIVIFSFIFFSLYKDFFFFILGTVLVLPIAFFCFVLNFFPISDSRVAVCNVEGERYGKESVKCYHVCSLMHWLDVLSTVFWQVYIQVLLFIIKPCPTKISIIPFLSLSLSFLPRFKLSFPAALVFIQFPKIATRPFQHINMPSLFLCEQKITRTIRLVTCIMLLVPVFMLLLHL